MSYNVLVVDDQIVPRQLFESFISASGGRYQLTASLDTAKIAYAWCAKEPVDLILMDIVMNDGFNGLEAAERIKKSFPHIKIIIVTSMPDALFLTRAREIGVDSFWYKEVQEEPILEIMDRTMAGEQIWPDQPPVVSLGMTQNTELTPRELDVLRLLAEGLTDREIAQRLFLSVTTVRYHVSNLTSKTGFSSRTELAVQAVRTGLIIPGIE